MLNIQPQYLPLSKLLDGRIFRIPEYQRAYSWAKSQREDLFGDLCKTYAKGADEAHFMATVVCLRRDRQQLGTDEFQNLDIVDGQQRITTLIILLKAVSLHLDVSDKAQEKLLNELQDLLVKPEADELLLLQTNHDSSHYFSNFLRGGVGGDPSLAKTLADREILQAITDCNNFVNEWVLEHSLLSLAALMKNRLYFLLHELDNEKSVYSVFEVLNSRGLTVSWLDRLKSMLMGAAFDINSANQVGLIKSLHVIWRDIYSVVGLRQGLSTEALRFAATLKSSVAPSRTMGEEESVDSLRELSKGGVAKIRKVAEWMLAVVKVCDSVLEDGRINAVTGIAQARLLAVAIGLRDDIPKEAKGALFSRWEKVTFRIYGMYGYDARTRVGDYVRLAWRVANEGLSVSDIDNALLEIGADFPIKEAVEGLRKANCYEGWEGQLRYVMFKYEEHLSRKQGLNFSNEQWLKIWVASPSDSIEHIFPKSKAPKKHAHRLGNLVLLPPRLNSKLQDRGAVDKVGDYTKTGLLVAAEVASLIKKKKKWTAAEIDKRGDDLLKWALVEWGD